jgi:hypothetical protein
MVVDDIKAYWVYPKAMQAGCLFEALRRKGWIRVKRRSGTPPGLRQNRGGCVCIPVRPRESPRSDTPIAPIKTAWAKAIEHAGVTGRPHDSRHTLITELAGSAAKIR